MASPHIQLADTSQPLDFTAPIKRIEDAAGLNHWRTSLAYTNITTFILQLNYGMFPTSTEEPSVLEPTSYGPEIQALRALFAALTRLIEDAPPDTGPRRFGNIAFRKWYSSLEASAPSLLSQHIPTLSQLIISPSSPSSPLEELTAYLLGSFGSPQRLDYGTGHELSFLAFLACLAKLHLLPISHPRHIVHGVFNPYLSLVRTLILRYTLEPAGSHGVWGLDDHFFLPYLFGSASLSPPLSTPSSIPATEGSAPWAPLPSAITDKNEVSRWVNRNMYFDAISFVHAVKRGPFWEHSPMLYDISGVSKGWAKINAGMIKMYAVEVLGKFPVVQHFVFGSILRWDTDPEAQAVSGGTVHATAVEAREELGAGKKAEGLKETMRQTGMVVGTTGLPATAAPWANQKRELPMMPAPWNDKQGPSRR